MPSQKQIIVQQPVPPDKPLGASNFINATKAFPASPIYKGEITDNERKENFTNLVMEGTVVGGNCLSSYNRDFVDAHDLNNVAVVYPLHLTCLM